MSLPQMGRAARDTDLLVDLPRSVSKGIGETYRKARCCVDTPPKLALRLERRRPHVPQFGCLGHVQAVLFTGHARFARGTQDLNQPDALRGEHCVVMG